MIWLLPLVPAIAGIGGRMAAGAAARAAARAAAQRATQQAARIAAQRGARETAQAAVSQMSKAGDKAKEAENTKENTGTVDCVSDCKEKNPKDPCEHLKPGGQRGGGLRGGSYGKTIGTRNKTESNHLVPRVSGEHVVSKFEMPAAQMPVRDHRDTESWGSSHRAQKYQEAQRKLVDAGEWRKSTANGIRDMRRVSQSNYRRPNEFNKQILEALEYQKCLEEHGISPGKDVK